MSNWISVDDRLPEIIEHEKGSIEGISMPVLVLLKQPCQWIGSTCSVMRCFKGGRGDLISIHWDDAKAEDVTHWQPLPEAPESNDE